MSEALLAGKGPMKGGEKSSTPISCYSQVSVTRKNQWCLSLPLLKNKASTLAHVQERDTSTHTPISPSAVLERGGDDTAHSGSQSVSTEAGPGQGLQTELSQP